jgi:hypothetical protein
MHFSLLTLSEIKLQETLHCHLSSGGRFNVQTRLSKICHLLKGVEKLGDTCLRKNNNFEGREFAVVRLGLTSAVSSPQTWVAAIWAFTAFNSIVQGNFINP